MPNIKIYSEKYPAYCYEYSEDIKEMIIAALTSKAVKIRSKNKIKYLNIPAAFDIETSRVQVDDNLSHSFMYIWQFGIGCDNDCLITYGRTWEQFFDLLNTISSELELNTKKRLVIYIHNMSYEIAFIARRFQWQKVFAVSARVPMFGLTKGGIEFRCSYLLSGLSLNNVGKSLTKYPAQKMVGDLDYSKIRSYKTPLTLKELGYCVNDIYVILCYIKEKIESDGSVAKIPYTKTGYVRQFCRRACYGGGTHNKRSGYREYMRFSNFIHSLTLDKDFYYQCRRGFAGGYTHANAWRVDKIFYNVGSYDLTSAYPAIECGELFPMSTPTLHKDITSDKDPRFNEYLKKYCCIFDVEFNNIESTLYYENYISVSKCYLLSKNHTENNGRLVNAEKIRITVTEVDFDIIRKTYTWDGDLKIVDFRTMTRGYLPRAFILAILELYKNKTELKGVEDQKAFYMNQKEMLNSTYGCSAQRAIQDLISFDSDADELWDVDPVDPDTALEKYNNSKGRFLYYPWALYVTARCRARIWAAIRHLGSDYCYTDTDSIKMLHPEKYHDYFNEFNEYIVKRLKTMCKYYDIDPALIEPANKYGDKKPLGVWDYEGTYKAAKFLGAKRYMIMNDHYNIESTVSGVKKSAVNWLVKTYGKYGALQHFSKDLVVPAGVSGKTVSVYFDEPTEGEAVDYLGQPFKYREETSVVINESDYHLNRTQDYIDYLLGITSQDPRGGVIDE